MSPVAVVTGASGGTGLATVAEFARRGDQVALLARRQRGLDAAAALRVAARAQQRARDHAADAGGEHTPALLRLSRLPKHPQPVPPIYQPEVTALAVVFSADHPKRREYWVGASTVGTLIANAVASGILDRYLGRTGFASQQSAKLRADGDPVDLWEPADGEEGRDFGARGVFGDRAKASSPQQWLSHRYPQLGAAAGLAGVAGAAAIVHAARRR